MTVQITNVVTLLKMHERFQKSVTPTRIIFAINVGKVYGYTEQDVRKEFEQFGEIDEVIMLDSPSCHIIFKNYEDALVAQEKKHNSQSLRQPDLQIAIRFCQLRPPNNGFPPNFCRLVTTSKECEDIIPGMIYQPEFITPEEETHILNFIQNMSWDTSMRRRVMHFGGVFDYRTLGVGAAPSPIPQVFDLLMNRLVSCGILPVLPNQVTVNEYLPGAGIAPHVDTHSWFAHAICSISLSSTASMEMTKIEPGKCSEMAASTIGIFLPRRSLIALTGPAKLGYTHGIPNRKTDVPLTNDEWQKAGEHIANIALPNAQSSTPLSRDAIIAKFGPAVKRGIRVSLTFRCVNETEALRRCNCDYPWACDTQTPQTLLTPTRLGPDGTTTLEEKV